MSKAEFISNPPFNVLNIDISQDADWNDPFQIFEGTGVPLDLTGAMLELYIRPTYDHVTLFKKLTSLGNAGIIIDDPQQGMAYFFLDRSVVLAELPVGRWKQFLVLTEGSLQTEIWRGSMNIHPGIIAP